MSMLFIVQGNGRHISSHLLLPNSTDPVPISLFSSPFLSVKQTEKGWMDKENFERIVRNFLLPAILQERSQLPSLTPTRALLLLARASSRQNRALMHDLSAADIDVLVLPAHSSSVTKPLDLCVNAIFKQKLREKNLEFPKKRDQKEKLGEFLLKLEDAAEEALLRQNVVKGFETACVLSCKSITLLDSLDPAPEGFKRHECTRFSLNGKVITSKEFQQEWEIYEGRKEEKKRRQSEKKKGKKPRDLAALGIEEESEDSWIQHFLESEEEIVQKQKRKFKLRKKKSIGKRCGTLPSIDREEKTPSSETDQEWESQTEFEILGASSSEEGVEILTANEVDALKKKFEEAKKMKD
jgi:hypothetical protein